MVAAFSLLACALSGVMVITKLRLLFPMRTLNSAERLKSITSLGSVVRLRVDTVKLGIKSEGGEVRAS